MFVLRAKCKLSDASGELAVYGLLGTAPAERWTLARQGTAVDIALPAAGAPRALRVQPVDEPTPTSPAATADQWAQADVSAGMAWVRDGTVEAFVPQMINFEVLGGVNFKKGCYPGQEVVARSQYRGTLKRRTQLWRSPVALQPGQEVFHSADPSQPAGAVVLAAPAADAWEALVETRLEALQGGSLHLGAADGPALQPGRLPYDVPFEAA